MNVSEKIKAINNKIEQNKGQYNLDRQIWMISAFLSGNFSKYRFLIGRDNSPGKYLTWCNQKKTTTKTVTVTKSLNS